MICFFEDRARRRSLWVLSFFFILIGIFTFVPFKSWQGIPLCSIKGIIGWPCPGCGLTRSMWHWMHGNWYQAIQFNALAPVVSVIILLYLFHHFRVILGKPGLSWKSERGQRVIAALFLLLLLSQGALNLFYHYQSL